MSSRLVTATKIRENFELPEVAIVHWDGKILKVKGGLSSERCCVYISGLYLYEKRLKQREMKQLLGVPESPNGTGTTQEEAVIKLLTEWNVSDRIGGLVFDTTASNTGQLACALIECALGRALLWIACRHHVYELHIKHVTESVTGNTKEPGVKLFWRLQVQWQDLKIQYENLERFDWKSEFPGCPVQAV